MNSNLVIDNAMLWIGDGQRLAGHVVIEDGRIAAVGPGPHQGSSLPRVDLGGQALSPGLIDLMVLGGFGKSILRDDPLDIARAYLKLGVTSCQFCIGTLPWHALEKLADKVTRARRTDAPHAAAVLGMYAEGPFQQPDLTGASARQYALRPTPENVERLLSALGSTLTMVNVAPGLAGDSQAVARLRQAGCVVSMAHSNASAGCVRRCIDAGTSVLGHVWNNNSGRIGDSGVQQPTLEHVALLDDRIRFIHLICDGVHVDPLMVQLVLRCRGIESLCLVTDAVVRAGEPDGPYQWDDGRSFIKSAGVGRTLDGWLAGSALLLPDHLRQFVRMTSLPAHQAIRTVTHNPARSLGLEKQIGLLHPGARADLVAWDANLKVQRVWRAGREVQSPNPLAEIQL